MYLKQKENEMAKVLFYTVFSKVTDDYWHNFVLDKLSQGEAEYNTDCFAFVIDKRDPNTQETYLVWSNNMKNKRPEITEQFVKMTKDVSVKGVQIGGVPPIPENVDLWVDETN